MHLDGIGHCLVSPWQARPAVSLSPARWQRGELRLSSKNLTWAREEVSGWLALKDNAALFSPAFVDQLAHHTLRASELLGARRYLFHIHSIYDAIGDVSGGRKRHAGSPRVFGDKPAPSLAGLHHMHFIDPQFLAHNLMLEVKHDFDRLWHVDFKKLRRNAGLEHEASIPKLAPLIAHTMGLSALKRRAGTAGDHPVQSRMTGEWIMYSEKSSQRVYLTLAVHDEATHFQSRLQKRLREAISALPDKAVRDTLYRKHPLLAS